MAAKAPGTAPVTSPKPDSATAAKAADKVAAPVPAPPPSPKAAGPSKSEPLNLEGADRFEGTRSTGEYILSGHVRFRHGTLTLETQRATWTKDRNIVHCDSGMRIANRGAVLTARQGYYDKGLNQAIADGAVFARDSSGEVELSGDELTYDRARHQATVSGQPLLKRITLDTVRADSASGRKPGPGAVAAAPPAPPRIKRDTLLIRGDVLEYNDSTRRALSRGHARITRERLHMECDQAEYRQADDSLFLTGSPKVTVDDNHIVGQRMRLSLKGETVRGLLVQGDAMATTSEPATDSSAARQSHVKGDSLLLAFRDGGMDSVQVFRHARGDYFDLDRPAYVNDMSGDYMVLRFSGKQVKSANVLGGAKSTYFHFEKRMLKGKNIAQGDTLDFAFAGGKVSEVTIRGNAKGKYYGEPARRKAAADSARGDKAGAPAPDKRGKG